jgi:hypothetical protein
MTFYTDHYLATHQQLNTMINYVIIMILLLLLLGTLFYYLRHRLQTKYRDLGIIIFLLILIFGGLQMTNMEQSQAQYSQSTRLRPFIRAVARDHHLAIHQVVVNSTTLTDGIIVRFNKKDYRVNFSPNGDNYTLTRTHVVDHHVNIQN